MLPGLLERAVGDERTVRKAAVEVITSGWAGEPEVTEWLRERSIADPDEDVRQVAAHVLPPPTAASVGDHRSSQLTSRIVPSEQGW